MDGRYAVAGDEDFEGVQLPSQQRMRRFVAEGILS